MVYYGEAEDENLFSLFDSSSMEMGEEELNISFLIVLNDDGP
jgi:hypothetical protein